MQIISPTNLHLKRDVTTTCVDGTIIDRAVPWRAMLSSSFTCSWRHLVPNNGHLFRRSLTYVSLSVADMLLMRA